jgi:two-component system chemotaxis response regulator CheY
MTGPIRVLVVDDSPVARKALMERLQEAGLGAFAFQEASNGAEALKLLDQGAYDLALVDWNMPELDGLDFVRCARQHPNGKATIYIMVTSESCVRRMQEALDNGGADEYICKPFGVEEIRRRVGKFVDLLRRRAGSIPPKRPFVAKFFG